jgi:hypothetical protein
LKKFGLDLQSNISRLFYPFFIWKKKIQTDNLQIEKEREMREAPWRQKKEKEKRKTSIFYVHFDCVSQKYQCPISREQRKEYRQLFVCFLFTIPVSPSLAPPCPPPHTDMKTPSIFTVDFFFKKPVTLLYIVYLWIKFMTSSLTKKFTRLLVFVPFVY